MQEKKNLTINESFALALQHHQKNNFQIAENLYRQILKINPNHVDSHNNLGILYRELGKNEEALTCYKNAILAKPNFTLAVNNLSILLKEIQLSNVTLTNSSGLKKLILLLFKRKDINHRDIFQNAKSLLFIAESNDQLKKIVNSNSLLLKNQIIQNLLKEELFLLMLQKSLMSDQFVEKMLTKLRYETLINLVKSDKNISEKNFDFIISLAAQCFLNEYVYVQSEKEINYVNQLIKEIKNNKEIKESKIAILGSYIPLLSNRNIADKLSNYKSKNVLFNDLLDMQINEPLREKKLINSIKSLGKISDSVSKKVRNQYEKYPYPRWRYTYSNTPTNFLNIINGHIKPNKIQINHKFNNPNVLIAGCGTGNHICQAANYLNANILGVDLSLTSLSYAKRKVEELGLKNIDFLHADILQLKDLKKKFDVIECVGVLHHMHDPLQGLKILVDLLEPSGLLLIGLYSEKARQDVIKAKDFAKKNKFENSFSGIRSFREAIFKEKNDLELRRLATGRDFYSISSVKDLIFHAHEYRFTLPEIFKKLENLNLEFLGFCDSKVKNKYSKLFRNDKKNTSFSNWNEFETLEPLAFFKMYTFWVRKK